jgi:signal transduction histidine kinase
MEPLLTVQNLTKQFGTLTVVQDISFVIYPGEVVGLAGRNGAGRSAMIQILAGLYAPDKGRIFLENQPLHFPYEIRNAGIRFIHQEPELVGDLDVTSNIFLGQELTWPWIDRWLKIPYQRRMKEEAARLLDRLGAHIPALDEIVRNLSGERRQLVAIAQAMVRPSKLIVVDDPTRWLTYPYQQKMLDLIQEWQAEGTAVLFSSNNLDHLFAVTDRILVLREGQVVADRRTDETTREEVVSALVGMVGRQQRTPVLWALDSYRRSRRQTETLRHNQALLERDLVAQDVLNQQLVEQLAQQVAALDSANLALQDAQRRLLTEREEERKHLARELHDQVIQDLLSLNYELEEIGENLPEPLELNEAISEVRQSIRVLIEDLRRVCGDLRPPTIDSLGLGAALQSLTRHWFERTGIEVELEMDVNFGRLPEALELSIFRIVQEGLNNVWKHAGASSVQVTLQHTSPRMLLISLADNGQGLPRAFDLADLSQDGHYGLLGISERVALLGGRLHVQNMNQGGLLLQVEIPHPRVVRENVF